MNQRAPFPTLLIALTASIGGCQRGKPEANPAAAQELKPTVIGAESYVVVKREQIQAGPRISGSLEPTAQAKVRSEASGSVIEVKVELGDAVKPGQLLARIEERSLRDAVISAESSARAAEQDRELAARQVARTSRLVQAGALAERDLETAQSGAAAAQARVDEAKSRLAQARKILEATIVKSPIAGVISERAVNQGDVVAPGAQLFTVIEPSSMRLQGSVPSAALGDIEVGRRVVFNVRGYRNQSFEGQISQIAPAADPVTRQITVLVSIPNPGGKLVAGLFADGRIATEAREGLVVPAAALSFEGDKAFATRAKDGVAERIPVETGIRDEESERVEIVGGVAEGDVLLTGIARGVPAGTAIKLNRGEPAS